MLLMSDKIKSKQIDIVKHYEKMITILNGVRRFKTEPAVVIAELTAMDAGIGKALESVSSMLNNQSELPKTIEIGMRLLYNIAAKCSDEVESCTAELHKEISYNRTTMVTNHTELINKIDKELISNNLVKILANTATKEYATNKIPLILDNGVSNKFEPNEFLSSLLEVLAKYSHCEDGELVSQLTIFNKETIYHNSEMKLLSNIDINKEEVDIPTVESRVTALEADINVYLEPATSDVLLTSLETLVNNIVEMSVSSISCIEDTKSVLIDIEAVDVGYIKLIKDKVLSLGSSYVNDTVTEQEYTVTLNNLNVILRKQLSSYTKLVDMVDDELIETNVNLSILDKAYGIIALLLINITVG